MFVRLVVDDVSTMKAPVS